jgi:hypothetical protein
MKLRRKTKKQLIYKRKYNRTIKQQYGGETEITRKIKEMVKGMDDGDEKKIKLMFKMFDIQYSTNLLFVKFNKSVYIGNTCIRIQIGDDNIESYIQGNIAEEPCFEPRLKTLYDPLRLTTSDVLQTLSTKLKLIFSDSINLIDAAVVDDMRLSWIRIMRGMPTLYEKYGYSSSDIDDIRKTILETSWGSLKTKWYFQKINKIAKEYNNEDITNESIVTVMKNIPYNIDNKHKISQTLALEYVRDINFHMKLNKDNEKWKYWDAAMIFTKMDEIV